MARDYYEVLGVERTASEQDIKRAYRNMARKWHPDANQDDPDAEVRFKEVGEAYAVLSNPEKRARYDRFGHAGVEGQAAGQNPFAGGDPFSGGLDDLFDAMFGGARRRSGRTGPVRGSDIGVEIALDFKEAAFGVKRDVTVRRMERCDNCEGSGARPGTSPVPCSVCGGTGEVKQTRQTILGHMVTVATCANCRGRGEVILTPCPRCKGDGLVNRNRTVTVNVPAGVDDGVRLRVSGEGEAGPRGGVPGDLYVMIRVRPHPRLRRSGVDVMSRERIGVAQAALGTTLQVETLDGTTDVKVAAGTQPRTKLRLRGKGIPRLDGYGRGDHYVEVEVEVPTGLSAEERKLLHELARLRDEQVDSDRSLLDRVKGAFGGKAGAGSN